MARKGSGEGGGTRITKAEKIEQALNLRKAKFSYPDIARAMGCSVGSAFNYVREGLAEVKKRYTMAAQEVLQVELASLDELEAVVIRTALSAGKGQLPAVDRVLRIKDMRNRLMDLYPKDGESAAMSPAETAQAIHAALAAMDAATVIPPPKVNGEAHEPSRP